MEAKSPSLKSRRHKIYDFTKVQDFKIVNDKCNICSNNREVIDSIKLCKLCVISKLPDKYKRHIKCEPKFLIEKLQCIRCKGKHEILSDYKLCQICITVKTILKVDSKENIIKIPDTYFKPAGSTNECKLCKKITTEETPIVICGNCFIRCHHDCWLSHININGKSCPYCTKLHL
jgi:hypothetical protein